VIISRVFTREGWPLLTVETEVNGGSKSTNERVPSLVGSLCSWCRYTVCYFYPAFAALVSLCKIFFLTVHYFILCMFPGHPAIRAGCRAGPPVSVCVSLVFTLRPNDQKWNEMLWNEYDLIIKVERGCSASPLLGAGPHYQEIEAVRVLDKYGRFVFIYVDFMTWNNVINAYNFPSSQLALITCIRLFCFLSRTVFKFLNGHQLALCRIQLAKEVEWLSSVSRRVSRS
jgi:hypothetical protein